MSEQLKFEEMGSAQGMACRLYYLHALQMLAGGDVQKERLTAMHERILQRTIPIEEVCYASHNLMS